MAIGEYPSVLPLPTVSGYAYETPDGVQRSEEGNEGYVGMRRRFSQRMAMVDVQFVLTQTQYRIFVGFWIWGALRGAGWFTISLRDGNGVATRIARFDGVPMHALISGKRVWRITAKLEVQPADAVNTDSPEVTAPGALSIALSLASTSDSDPSNGGPLVSPTITSSVTGGIAPYTYAWTKTSGNTFGLSNASTASSQAFTSTANGTGIVYTAVYRLTVTDAQGSTAYDEITITHTYVQGDLRVTTAADQRITTDGSRRILAF